MKKIAVFASGNGTNAENIVKYFSNDEDISVSVIISNNPNAGVHERAKRLHVPSVSFSKEDFADASFIVEKLAGYGVDFIVLAGFLKKIPDSILQAYPQKILNIHPALLPKYGGKGMYGMRVHEAVVAGGEKESGITIHYIDDQYDEGRIVFQARCPVLPTDTPEEVAEKVHALEYKYFPEVIRRIVRHENLHDLI